MLRSAASRLRLSLFLTLVLFRPSSADALDVLTVHSGMLLVTNKAEGPPSLLVPPLGAWIPVAIPAPPGYFWEAGLMLVGMNYRYEDGRGVPVEVEAADNFWVAGLIPDLRIGRLWDVGDSIAIGGFAGLAALIRVPVIPHDNAAQDYGALAGFFASRFLFPEVVASLRWAVLEDLRLTFDLRAMYPLHNLWDADSPSPIDHLTTGLLVGLQFDV